MPVQSHSRAATRLEISPGLSIDSRRALWFARERRLVIADLHWGYATAHRARGNLLPLWGDAEIAARLDALIADYAPAEMLWLGDIVHAAEGASAAEAYLARAPVPITLVGGNHDRRWARPLAREVRSGGYVFHHGDRLSPGTAGTPLPAEAAVQVVGHFHPAVTWYDGAGTHLKLPALVVRPDLVVLPAFSPWAGGVDCTPLLTAGATVWALAPNRIFAVGNKRMVSPV